MRNLAPFSPRPTKSRTVRRYRLHAQNEPGSARYVYFAPIIAVASAGGATSKRKFRDRTRTLVSNAKGLKIKHSPIAACRLHFVGCRRFRASQPDPQKGASNHPTTDTIRRFKLLLKTAPVFAIKMA